MEEYNFLKDFNFLNVESVVHYFLGYIFAHMFWIKDERWEKIQPAIGFIIVAVVAYSSYGK